MELEGSARIQYGEIEIIQKATRTVIKPITPIGNEILDPRMKSKLLCLLYTRS